jgi:hypothetical protein
MSVDPLLNLFNLGVDSFLSLVEKHILSPGGNRNQNDSEEEDIDQAVAGISDSGKNLTYG